ncbi:MAG: ABC transporter substrate-binding protein [Gammaproteobacteria bacterium]
MTPYRLPRLLAALIFFVSLAVAAQDSAQAPPATAAVAVVERLHEALLESMRGGADLGHAGRVEVLAPVIHASFDFPTIARIVTGRAWKDASEAQRTAFIDVFGRLSVATYATNFSSFDGERFVTGQSEDSRGARIVHTELVKADGEAIPLDYMLHPRDGDWRIVNVVAQGVSDLSLKRAEYTAVIQSDGLDSLITRLREKVGELAR